MASNYTNLSLALRNANFIDLSVVRGRARTAYKAGKPLPDLSKTGKGFFRKYADPRAHGRMRIKFEVRPDTAIDAQDVAQIAARTVPEAYISFSPNGMSVTITWTEG